MLHLKETRLKTQKQSPGFAPPFIPNAQLKHKRNRVTPILPGKLLRLPRPSARINILACAMRNQQPRYIEIPSSHSHRQQRVDHVIGFDKIRISSRIQQLRAIS